MISEINLVGELRRAARVTREFEDSRETERISSTMPHVDDVQSDTFWLYWIK